ncbi:MAG TPA: hypothetical protein VNN77_07515 [candidate division Zixibacteria bacterium]|nr:hypothetical protein [candidate division Zixibacteria bacterium]
MTVDASLREKLDRLLRWERRKRREAALVAVAFYAFAGALVLLPLSFLWSFGFERWLAPAALALAAAPFFVARARWSTRDSLRALRRLDLALNLEERALTAWEILARGSLRPAERLVLAEAGEKLEKADPLAVLPRQKDWKLRSLAPVAAVWLVLAWSIGERPWGAAHDDDPRLRSRAEKLGAFARELQEKAAREGLPDSLAAGRELESLARKALQKRLDHEQFADELAAAGEKIAALSRRGGAERKFLAAQSVEHLADLKSELEVARNLSHPPELQKGRDSARLLERLEGLPHLRRELERSFPGSADLDRERLRSFFERLEQELRAELDRRSLIDAERFLERLLEEPRGEETQTAGSRREGRFSGSGDRAHGPEPGTEPGRGENLPGPPPRLGAAGASRLTGILGEGESAGMWFPATPSGPGKAAVSREEVVASYRRQAEAELETEPVPEALKETIRNYFLSLSGERSR